MSQEPDQNVPHRAESTHESEAMGLGVPRWEVLQYFASACSISFDAVAARQAIMKSKAEGAVDQELAPQAIEELTRAGRQIGLRIESKRMGFRDVMALVPYGPLATCWVRDGTEAWFVLTKFGRNTGEVLGSFGTSKSISRDTLNQLLDSFSPDGMAIWASAQPAILCDMVRSRLEKDDYVGTDHAEQRSAGHHSANHAIFPLTRLYQLLRPERSDIATVAVFASVVGLLGLATPVAVEALVNIVSFGRLLQPLLILCLILFVSLGFAAILRVLQTYIAELIQRRIFVRVVSDLAYRLPRIQVSALDRQHGPELMNRFFDVMTVQKSAALLVVDGIAIVIQSLIGMVVLAIYHPYLLGFDLFLLASLAFVVFVLGRGAVHTAISESKAKYAVAASLEELAEFTVSVKAQGGPRRALERADLLTKSYLHSRQKHFQILLKQVVFSLGLQAVSGSLLLGIGGWLVINGRLTLGQLVASELIVALIVGAFAKLGKHMESFYDLLAAVDKLGHLFDLPTEHLAGETLPSRTLGASVDLHDITFSFHGEESLIRSLSLHIDSNQVIALVGRSDGAKSVLLDIAYGLRTPNAGYVLIDGIDLRAIEPESLREQVAMVRSVELFTGTIAENLQLDRHNVSSQDIREAMLSMGLWDDVLSMTDGMESLLNPGGGVLSDSQARRLMLARAMVGKPRLLLIDGTLDALPDHVLPGVIDCLLNLSRSCTIVIATGRDDVARHGHRIVALPPENDPGSGTEAHRGTPSPTGATSATPSRSQQRGG